ncbi:MAG: serine/threonine-protein phosphatase [Rhodothermaceae bacterium TMED105]|nr:MAG: serine/threonine-protein phosphatase [Rhodothermaceae bacterium TMED105]|tara:strand:- start:13405 stop:14673 length:1269 start_codon:yes stop_codon:yes gene_type:complete
MSTPTSFEGDRDLERKESELIALTEAITSLHAQHTEEGVLRVFKYTLMGQLGIKSFALTRLTDGEEEILVAHGIEKTSSQPLLTEFIHIDRRQDGPLLENGLKGQITILERFETNELQPTDIRFIKTITQLCLQSIEKLRLQRVEVEQETLQKELSIVRSIQDSLLPNRRDPHEPWDVAWAHHSAKEVGGDLIDVVEDTANHRLVVMIADGAGKGIPGALLMSSVQALFQYLATQGSSVGDIAHAMNHQLLTSTPADTFVTATLLDVELPSANDGSFHVNYVNAGHPSGYMIKHGERVSMDLEIHLEVLPSTAPLLGVSAWEPSVMEEATQRLLMSSKDILCWLTDGVLEQDMENATQLQEMIVGEQRCGDWLLEAIATCPPDATSQEILDGFIHLYQSRVTPVQGDDQTIVMLRSGYSTSS